MNQFEQVIATSHKETDRADREKKRADEAEDKLRVLLERLNSQGILAATKWGEASSEGQGTVTDTY